MITIQSGHAVVIDDEPANRDFLERLLQTAGFKVSGAANGADGLRACRAVPQLALALVDQELPDAKGLEILSQLRAENPESLLVMATMHDDRTLIDEAFAVGVDVFLVKPHGFMELYRRLQGIEADTTQLRRVIIDQYGPRPYRGVTPKEPIPTTRPDEEVTRPAQRTDVAAAASAANAANTTTSAATNAATAPTAPVVEPTDPTLPRPAVTASDAPTLPAAPTTSATPATPAPTPAPVATTPPAPASSPAASPAAYTPPKEQPPTTPFATPTAPSTAPAAPPSPTPAPQPPAAESVKPSEQPTLPSTPVNTAPVTASPTADTPVLSTGSANAEDADKESTHTDVTIPRRPKDLNLDPKPM